MFRRVAIACIAALVMSEPAAAQEKSYSVTVGGAIVGPLSDSADRFTTGFGFTAGAIWHISDQVGLAGDYVWSALGTQRDWPTPPLAHPVGVTPRIQFGTVNIRFQAPPAKVRLYALAGLGLYHRSVTLAASGTGTISVCDPWWFLCNAGPAPAGSISGTRASTDPGVNLGAGFTAGSLFAEIRYHFMWGPTFDAPEGKQTATGKFMPLTVGVMF